MKQGNLRAPLRVVRYAVQRHRDQQALRRKAAALELVERLALAANASNRVEDALAAALEEICRFTGWSAGHATVIDRNGMVVELPLWWFDDAERFAALRAATEVPPHPPGPGLLGRVIRGGAPVWIPDVRQDPHFSRAARVPNLGVTAAIAFPVLVGCEVVAVLEFFSVTAEARDEELLDLFAHLGLLLGRTVERERAEEQLRQAQKMEAIGRLAGGVAHDFNNMLSVINGYADLLLFDTSLKDSSRLALQDIRRAGERAASLTRQLLAFSRQQMITRQVLDLNQLLADLEKMLRRMIGEDVELLVDLAPDLALVEADPGQLNQVVLNLVVNARDAMPRGGRLTLATRNVTVDPAQERRHRDWASGEYVLLSVGDTGCGMDPATQERIFDPFFTTKPAGEGTGLGLATVYGIVRQSEGQIEVESEPGEGATFRAYLPRAAAGTLEAPEEAEAARPGKETILLVEDEEMLRKLAQAVLERHGYRVLTAATAEDALRLLRHRRSRIDLLLTDVVMPGGMNGRELAERVQSLHPAVRVLFMSGYTSDTILRHGIAEDPASFVHKPFTAEALAARVRELLDGDT